MSGSGTTPTTTTTTSGIGAGPPGTSGGSSSSSGAGAIGLGGSTGTSSTGTAGVGPSGVSTITYWPTEAQLVAIDPALAGKINSVYLADYAGQAMNLPSNTSTAFADAILNLEGKFPNVFDAMMKQIGNPYSTGKNSLSGWMTVVKEAFIPTQLNGGFITNVKPYDIPSTGAVKPTAVQNPYGAAVTSATVSQTTSAFDTLQTFLTSAGLEADIPYVKDLILKQGDQLINTGTLEQIVRGEVKTGDPKMDKFFQTTYDNAFPGLRQHNESLGAGSEKMTETQYQTYVQSIMGTAQQYGLPQGFLTKAEIGQLVEGNVSATEFSDRIAHLYTAAANADPATKQMLQQYYGLTNGDLAAHFADPNKAYPLLERQLTSATLGGYANEVGLQGITQAQAQELANRVNQGGTSSTGATLGAQSIGSIESAMLTASRDKPLMGNLPGANAPAVSTTDLLGSQVAGFGGTTQTVAQQAVARAEQAKAAPFEKGGGYEADAKGVVGIGSART